MLKLMVVVQHRITHSQRWDRGATAVEYGLMVSLIAAVIVTAVALLGTNLNTLFTNVANTI
jgi:pilus assembly protein Flp/PilA